ncbi:unnamed protein product [Closterium sp. Naga37s-1]|nr:unnamed protein product [Closterium sp. Naga37s-1]
MLPSFMVKLFWKRMDEVAEGVGVGGGAEHEGGGEGAPRVVVEYSYEEEEEIEEDTSRQAQHGVSGPGSHANEHEGSSSSDESVEHDGENAGEHPGGTERTEEHGVALGEQVDVRVKHIEQQATGDDGDVEEQEGAAAAQEGGAGVSKLLEGARTKLDEMSGKIIEGVAAAITKASEDAVEKQIKFVEERLVASVVKGIEKAVKENLFYSTLPPKSMKELKDVVREGYQEPEVLTEAMARGFRGSAGPSTRSRQEEGVAGVATGLSVEFMSARFLLLRWEDMSAAR